MNENQSEGAAKVVLGKVESAAGEELGDPLIRARGAVLQVEGRVQEAAGGIMRTIEGEPFMTMAVGVAVGLLAGLFIAAKRTKVIYVKPRA